MDTGFPEWLGWAYWTPARSEVFRNFSLAVAGIISLIFLIWRAISTDRSAQAALRQADIALRQLEHAARQSDTAMRQAEAAARQSEAAAKQALIASDRQVTDVLSRTVDQLGDQNSVLVRMAAVHVLGRIARDSAKDHDAIVEVLAAYIREKAKRPDEAPLGECEADDRLNFKTEMRKVLASDNYWIRARLTFMRRALEASGRLVPDFDEVMASHVHSAMESLPIWIKALHVDPIDPDVQAALSELGTRCRKHEPPEKTIDLNRTMLQGASLNGCDHSQTSFSGSILRGASFVGANLRECIAVGTDFSGAMLIRTCLNESNLVGANFRGAILRETTLVGADISAADFTDAIDLTQAQIDGAHGNEHTLLPSGLLVKKSRPDQAH